MFTLDPQLAADTFDLGSLSLCRVLLMNDERYPWLILVPQLVTEQGDALRELHQVTEPHDTTLWQEINRVSKALEAVAQPKKLNVAALGNMVPQLHIHVIARQTSDSAWPGPVWGIGTAVAYETARREAFSRQLKAKLNLY